MLETLGPLLIVPRRCSSLLIVLTVWHETSLACLGNLGHARHSTLTSRDDDLLEVEIWGAPDVVLSIEGMVNWHFAIEVLVIHHDEIMLVLKFLVNRQMLHPCSLIDQVNVRLLLLLSVIVDIRFSLERHAISLRLQLLVHLLKW